jgi:hypothetical protein
MPWRYRGEHEREHLPDEGAGGRRFDMLWSDEYRRVESRGVTPWEVKDII